MSKRNRVKTVVLVVALLFSPFCSNKYVSAQTQEDANWQVEYRNSYHFAAPPDKVASEPGPFISHDWQFAAPIAGIRADDFSAHWTRRAYFEGGIYRFESASDDGNQVWIDGHLLINGWWDHARQSFAQNMELSDGLHTVDVYFYDRGREAIISVNWTQISHNNAEACSGDMVALLDIAPFAEAFSVADVDAQRDPSVLVVTCGPSNAVQQVVRPPATVRLTDTTADLRFESQPNAAGAAGVFLENVEKSLYLSIIDHLSLTAVNTATLHSLKWQPASPGLTLNLKPDQVVVFKTALGISFAMQLNSTTGLVPFDFQIKKFNSCSSTQFADIDPAKTVVPEPGTFALFGLGLAGIGYVMRRKQRLHSVKTLALLVILSACFGLNAGAQTPDACFTFAKGGTGTGTVWVGDKECGVDCQTMPVACQPDIGYVFKAIPAAGSKFVRWEDGNGIKIDLATYEAKPGATIVAVFEQVPWTQVCATQYEKVKTCIMPVFEKSKTLCPDYLMDAQNCIETRDFASCIGLIGALRNANNASECGYNFDECDPVVKEMYQCATPLLGPCRECLLGVFSRVKNPDTNTGYCSAKKAEAEACLGSSDPFEQLRYNQNCEEMFTLIMNNQQCLSEVRKEECFKSCLPRP